MDRVYQSNAIETPPSTVASSGSYPTAGNKASGQLATVPGPYWFYSITEEIRNAIIRAGLSPDSANVNQLADALSKYLPLSGGTMTGTLYYGANRIVKTNTSGFLSVHGATDTEDGAGLWLHGNDCATNGGEFWLRATDDGGYTDLKGAHGDVLRWGGKCVVTVVDSGTVNSVAYVCYSDGVMHMFGQKISGQYVSFPVPFISTPKVMTNYSTTSDNNAQATTIARSVNTTRFMPVLYVNNTLVTDQGVEFFAFGHWK